MRLAVCLLLLAVRLGRDRESLLMSWLAPFFNRRMLRAIEQHRRDLEHARDELKKLMKACDDMERRVRLREEILRK